jgi:hypothetical protein
MSIVELRKAIEPTLLSQPGVTGVGNVGDTLRIYVEGTDITIPSEIDGHPVEVFKTGPIKALYHEELMPQEEYAAVWHYHTPYDEDFSLSGTPWLVPAKSVEALRQSIVRPVPGGVSIGHPTITAGTHGVSLRFLGINAGLSNNHVLAAGSTFQQPRANIGDPIYQPGPYDGGREADIVGNLSWFNPIDTQGSNLIDAALWQPTTADLMSEEVLDIGIPAGIGTVNVGDIVQKSGRTSGYKSAEVIDINATISVNYGDFKADFRNQIITDIMGEPGDSGSAVFDMTGPNLVGLLFAGSNYVTVHNHIGNILNAIGPIVQPPNGGGAVSITAGAVLSTLLLAFGLS